jgi:hypothetical protein
VQWEGEEEGCVMEGCVVVVVVVVVVVDVDVEVEVGRVAGKEGEEVCARHPVEAAAGVAAPGVAGVAGSTVIQNTKKRHHQPIEGQTPPTGRKRHHSSPSQPSPQFGEAHAD